MNGYKFFLKRNDVDSPEIDIESEFKGLQVLSCENVNKIGKAKNVYTESFPEVDRIRTYLPNDGNYVNEATTITLKVLINGNAVSRQDVFNRFVEYIRFGEHHYRDTYRKCEFDFIVKDEIKVVEEENKGDNPYIIIEVPLQNLNGSTKFTS